MADYSKNHDKGEAIQSELYSLCGQLGKLVEKKTALFWHTKNFQKYIRNDTNPYGLCIQIFPLIENISLDFKKKWNNLQLCTCNIMQLLMEEYRARTVLLEKDIDRIYTKLQTFKNLPVFKDQEERIKNLI